MARPPKCIKGETVTACLLNLACRLKAQRLGITKYSLPQLEQESGIDHSVVIRAVGEDSPRGPTLATIQKLAETLEVSLERDLEDRFYNAFGYASPRQFAEVQSYVEQIAGEDAS